MSERHIYPAMDRGLVEALSVALLEQTPPSESHRRMRARILAGAENGAGIRVQRAEEGQWRTVFPGVQIRHLHVDREAGAQMALWRLAAGACIPGHGHRIGEECLVLEGSIVQAGTSYVAGDFLFAPAGSPHPCLVAEGGAVLLIRGELPPASLVAPPEHM